MENNQIHSRLALSSVAALVAGLLFISVNAKADMMGGSMPAQQSAPMQNNKADSTDADHEHDHEMMKDDHEQMKKDHKKMKKGSQATTADKHKMMQKMGKKKGKPMPMNNSAPGMMDDSMPPDPPKDPNSGMSGGGMEDM